MTDFCAVRETTSHGHWRRHRGHSTWTLKEHLFLAAWALPLTAKRILSEMERYSFTPWDRTDIYSFEALADEEFLRPERGARGRRGWPLDRIRSTVGGRVTYLAMLEHADALAAEGEADEENQDQ